MISKGFTYEAICQMSNDDYEDWEAAAKALDIQKELKLINIAMWAHPTTKQNKSARTNEFNKLKNEQLLLLCENPYKRDENLIKQTKKLLKKGKSFSV